MNFRPLKNPRSIKRIPKKKDLVDIYAKPTKDKKCNHHVSYTYDKIEKINIFRCVKCKLPQDQCWEVKKEEEECAHAPTETKDNVVCMKCGVVLEDIIFRE